MEYYSTLSKEGNAAVGVTTGMNHEDIMLSEINQSKENNYCMIPLTGGS